MAGVIPAIFAKVFCCSQHLSPNGSARVKAGLLQDIALALGGPAAEHCTVLGWHRILLLLLPALLQSKDVADNLKKVRGIVGIRPGEHTARYIDSVLTKLTMVGAVYMTAVCHLPDSVVWLQRAFYLGGTSLLIVVVVVMDTMAQIQSHLMSSQYESLMKES